MSTGTAALHLCLLEAGVEPGRRGLGLGSHLHRDGERRVVLRRRGSRWSTATRDVEPRPRDRGRHVGERADARRPAASGRDRPGAPARTSRAPGSDHRSGGAVRHTGRSRTRARGAGHDVDRGRRTPVSRPAGRDGRGVLVQRQQAHDDRRGGGAIAAADPARRAAACATSRSRAKVDGSDYEHDVIGYNYRLSHVSAAIGDRPARSPSERARAPTRSPTRTKRRSPIFPMSAPSRRASWARTLGLAREHRARRRRRTMACAGARGGGDRGPTDVATVAGSRCRTSDSAVLGGDVALEARGTGPVPSVLGPPHRRRTGRSDRHRPRRTPRGP